MGGKSTSKIAVNEQGELEYSGHVNTSGGGFASCRTKEVDLGLKESNSGVKVTYKNAAGDNIFKVSITSGRFNWTCVLPTENDGSSQTVTLPFSDFKAYKFGKHYANEKFDHSKAKAVGINATVFDKQG